MILHRPKTTSFTKKPLRTAALVAGGGIKQTHTARGGFKIAYRPARPSPGFFVFRNLKRPGARRPYRAKLLNKRKKRKNIYDHIRNPSGLFSFISSIRSAQGGPRPFGRLRFWRYEIRKNLTQFFAYEFNEKTPAGFLGSGTNYEKGLTEKNDAT